MKLNVVQNTQINQNPFFIVNSSEIDYPISPLVSAEFINANTFSIRATLYIDSADNALPNVEENPIVIDNSLQLYFDYNFQEEIPQSLNVWYLELDYALSEGEQITSITSFLKNIDPETSRGTVVDVRGGEGAE